MHAMIYNHCVINCVIVNLDYAVLIILECVCTAIGDHGILISGNQYTMVTNGDQGKIITRCTMCTCYQW